MDPKYGGKLDQICSCANRAQEVMKEFQDWRKLNDQYTNVTNAQYQTQIDLYNTWVNESIQARATKTADQYNQWLITYPEPQIPTGPTRTPFKFSQDPILCCSQVIDADTIKTTDGKPFQISNIAQNCMFRLADAAKMIINNQNDPSSTSSTSSTSSPSTAPSKSPQISLSPVAIAGIVIGSILLIAFIISLFS